MQPRSPQSTTRPGLTRRTVLRAWLALPASVLLAACATTPASTPTQPAPPTTAPPQPTVTQPVLPTPTRTAAVATTPAAAPQATATPAPPPPTPTPATAQTLAPTPACDDGDDPTPAQTEGPYFKRSSPERASLLEPGMAGTKLVVAGHVLATNCQPVARALLDFWQADDSGAYDNSGFRLRGHQFTDQAGRYRLETIMPGLYPGRTRHIHVKVQAPNRPELTTQLYFPNEAGNARDRIFDQALVMTVKEVADGKEASFDFVLRLG